MRPSTRLHIEFAIGAELAKRQMPRELIEATLELVYEAIADPSIEQLVFDLIVEQEATWPCAA